MNFSKRFSHAFVVCLFLAGFVSSFSIAAESVAVESRLKSIFAGTVDPQNVDDLRAMQKHVQSLTDQALQTTVGVQVGAAQGSGVIISPDGYVLTAAHVIGKSERDAFIYLRDGRRVAARTLGTFRTMDAGLLKINPQPVTTSWPYAPVGDATNVELGQWCLATGHPGGIQSGRQPSVRLGRVLTINLESAISTDCTLIGGDSGGPLFDMNGTVVGIHSRIGGPLTANLHIPVNTFQKHWDQLARGDNWGQVPGSKPFIGVKGEANSSVARLTQVFAKSPAEQAGLKVDDIVVSFAGKPVRDFDVLRSYVDEQEPGTRVPVEIIRGNQRLSLEVVIGRVRE